MHFLCRCVHKSWKFIKIEEVSSLMLQKAILFLENRLHEVIQADCFFGKSISFDVQKCTQKQTIYKNVPFVLMEWLDGSTGNEILL